MSLVKIQFLVAGEWADHPADPIFEVEADQILDVSVDLANVAVAAGKARFIDSDKELDIKCRDAEAERVNIIRTHIQGLDLQEILGDELNSGPLRSEALKGILEFLEGAEIDESFEEFQAEALEMKETSISTLVKRIERAEKAEADAAELEEFRKGNTGQATELEELRKREAGLVTELTELRKKEAALATEAGPKAKAEGKGKGKK